MRTGNTRFFLGAWRGNECFDPDLRADDLLFWKHPLCAILSAVNSFLWVCNGTTRFKWGYCSCSTTLLCSLGRFLFFPRFATHMSKDEICVWKSEWVECDFHYLDLFCLFKKKYAFAALKSVSVMCESIIFIQKFERVSSQKNMLMLARPLQIMFPSSRLFVFLSTQSPSDSSKARRRVAAQIGAGGCSPGATRQIANLKGVLSAGASVIRTPVAPRASKLHNERNDAAECIIAARFFLSASKRVNGRMTSIHSAQWHDTRLWVASAAQAKIKRANFGRSITCRDHNIRHCDDQEGTLKLL